MINRYKVYRIVEYVKQSGFVYEVDELKEDIEGILANYGIIDLCDEEYDLLRAELLPLAEQFEFSEVLHLVAEHELNPISI
ncbi:MAG: hypothetical protein KKC75_03750 [Nanoarchaeota archaeon]|nr:hypothetical protein [Nanoarchaeota archaeon]MBU1005643.1 hypothetical protein [Nanoarchaeota archaeon]MBU1945812.1 hypothetical protein [Nanoarchaeota archaeon]